MLTTRGWRFLLIVLGLLVISLFTTTIALTLVCLTLLTWFLGNWLLFAMRLRLAEGRLRVERWLEDQRGPVESLWARQTFQVRVALTVERWVSLPYVQIYDRLPPLARPGEGNNSTSGRLGPQQPIELSYALTCPVSGRLRFEGLAVQVADLQGFFAHALFVHAPAVYRVLPALADAKGHVPSAKRFNLIPLFGVHRHPRPGSGSELLNLRDYLPGDPPKTIAWKASARRDRLITKEFESEVPVRCTLFLDAAQGVRVGPRGENALARLVEIAAALAQANAGIRDLTGLCVVDEAKVLRWIRPARGPSHVVALFNILAEVADLPPGNDAVPLRQLLALGFGLAQEVYPDQMRRAVNAFPWWLPFWSPRPAYTLPPPSFPGPWWQRLATLPVRTLRYLALALRQATLARLSITAHRLYRWRKQLAAVLSVRYHLDPGGLTLLLEDDGLCAEYTQRFLTEHGIPCPTPLYDAQGRYLFASAGKLDVLARSLLQAVARGHDNELFVLLVDFLEAGPDLQRVLRAVRVALARHHQVMVVCPWPPGIALPTKEGVLEPILVDDTAEKQRKSSVARLEELMLRGTTVRLHQAFAEMKRAFAKLGVQVLCAPEEQAVALILHRLQRLRQLERGFSS